MASKGLARVVKLYIAEGSLVKKVVARVVKRGVAGPGGNDYWVVETKPRVFVEGLPPATFLIIGPGGQAERLDWLDKGTFETIGCHVMLDKTGRGNALDSFDFTTAYDFGRGDVTRL